MYKFKIYNLIIIQKIIVYIYTYIYIYIHIHTYIYGVGNETMENGKYENMKNEDRKINLDAEKS